MSKFDMNMLEGDSGKNPAVKKPKQSHRSVSLLMLMVFYNLSIDWNTIALTVHR